MKKYFIYLFIATQLNSYVTGTNEIFLRENLFQNYDKNIRPVINDEDNILLKYGLEISNLVFFDQKSENIKLTMKKTMSWWDHYLKWNLTEHTLDYITVKSDKVWQPDLELYNAASQPEVFEKNPLVKIYNDGRVEFTRYVSYSFACKLDLKEFPYDKQTCKMLFGSWKYPKKILNIVPFNSTDYFSNFSVSPDFSHNEWNIDSINVLHEDYTYKCCPGDLWPNSEFSITLRRNPQKYNIMIIMAIFVTLSALFVNIIVVSNFRRTYILVFIPLTLIWLQIHISSRIPVIEYSTKLEDIVSCCFYTTIVSAFESGIIYCFLSNKYHYLDKFLDKFFDINEYISFKMGYHLNEIRVIKKHDKSIENIDYVGLRHKIGIIDNIFRFTITIVFSIVIAVLLK